MTPDDGDSRKVTPAERPESSILEEERNA